MKGTIFILVAIAVLQRVNGQTGEPDPMPTNFQFFRGRGDTIRCNWGQGANCNRANSPCQAVCKPDSPCDRVSDGKCWRCLKGKYMLPGLQCVACEAGRYRESVYAPHNTCKVCEPGKYTDENERIGCKSCPTGFFNLACVAGSSAAGPQGGCKVCSRCASGQYADAQGSSACKACPAGMFGRGDQTTSAYCQKCPNGWFVGKSGETQCERCHRPVRSLGLRMRPAPLPAEAPAQVPSRHGQADLAGLGPR